MEEYNDDLLRRAEVLASSKVPKVSKVPYLKVPYLA